ncbi:acyltransferase family protein [Marinomonas balearica]|uniref:Peptidoglycan/LPS O-acetylase OafA/YrhL n=1 Tax=Marinomonas balearica TaxID=491947 RepID=A0A4V3CG16_9GAMM|nr:acyltransferase family protein [Marinomonas balearica]TDO95992.1 peptidoglycan/LPS O-acetylase OafA/YrhL [Marinomonas balearica]
MKNKIYYRPEVDGLRAVAILFVLIYHAGFSYNGEAILKGGYIGVDVFLVISGYLISSILIREVKDGEFSLLKFYERRFRRIFPALIFVLLTTVVVFYFVLPPKALKEFSLSALSTLFFSANFFFYFEDSYMAEASQLKPLLHMWSLAIEEQYYIFFPFLILLLTNKRKLVFLGSIFLLFFMSLLFSTHMATANSEANFFLLPSRVWEFLVGTVIAFNTSYLIFKKKSYIYDIVSLIGLSLIFSSAIFFDFQTKHPSFYTLFPVLGSALIILFSNNSILFNRFISSKLLVFIGLISYSLYLWHVPVLVFGRYLGYLDNNLNKFTFLFFSFFLSLFTFYFVESVFRSKKNFTMKKLYLIFLPTSFLLFIFLVFFVFTGGANYRYSNIDFDAAKLSSERRDYVKKNKSKVFQDNGLKNIVIVGDSMSEGLFISLKSSDWGKGKFNVQPLPFDDTCFMAWYNFDRFENLVEASPYIYRRCDVNKLNRLKSHSLIENADIIIVSAAWTNFSTSLLPGFIDYLHREYLPDRVILIQRQVFKGKIEDMLIEYASKEVDLSVGEFLYKNRKPDQVVVDRLKKISIEENAEFIDLSGLVCNVSDGCIYKAEDESLYIDHIHWSVKGAELVGEKIIDEDVLLSDYIDR